jgi:hypothetical protein
MIDDGDFCFLDVSWTNYGTGAVDLVVYVEDASEVRVGIAQQSAWVRERLTRLILVSDALPDGVLDGIDPVVERRLAAGQAIVVRRTCSEQAAEDAEKFGRRTAPRDDVDQGSLMCSGTRCRLTAVVRAPGDLARVLTETHVSKALPDLTELYVVGGDGDVLDEVPELKARVSTGALAFVHRGHAEQEDLDADKAGRQFSLHPVGDDVRRLVERAPDPRSASLVAPPLSATALAGQNENDDTPPRGLMAKHVGEAIDRADLSDVDDRLDPRVAARVRAWDVPALRGRLLVIHDVTRIASTLRGLLFEVFGDVPFRVEGGGYGGLAKYLHFHTTVIAPPDGDRPMALELYGSVVSIGDPRQTPREMGRALLAARRRTSLGYDHTTRAGRRAAALAGVGGELPTPICVRLQTATWANVMYPGVGVPFYM